MLRVYGVSECYQKWRSITYNKTVSMLSFRALVADFLSLSPSLPLSLSFCLLSASRCVIKSAKRRLPPLSSHLRVRVLCIPSCMQICMQNYTPTRLATRPFSTRPFSTPLSHILLEWMNGLNNYQERKAHRRLFEIGGIRWTFQKKFY